MPHSLAYDCKDIRGDLHLRARLEVAKTVVEQVERAVLLSLTTPTLLPKNVNCSFPRFLLFLFLRYHQLHKSENF